MMLHFFRHFGVMTTFAKQSEQAGKPGAKSRHTLMLRKGPARFLW